METVLKVIRVFLGIVFIYAGVSKIIHPFSFAITIYNYQIVPEVFITPLSILLPWVEFILGLFLVFGIFMEGGVLLASFLLGVFTLALIFNYIRGVDVNCGCFSFSSAGSKAHVLWYILRDLILFSLSVFLTIRTIKKRLIKT